MLLKTPIENDPLAVLALKRFYLWMSLPSVKMSAADNYDLALYFLNHWLNLKMFALQHFIECCIYSVEEIRTTMTIKK